MAFPFLLPNVDEGSGAADNPSRNTDSGQASQAGSGRRLFDHVCRQQQRVRRQEHGHQVHADKSRVGGDYSMSISASEAARQRTKAQPRAGRGDRLRPAGFAHRMS